MCAPCIINMLASWQENAVVGRWNDSKKHHLYHGEWNSVVDWIARRTQGTECSPGSLEKAMPEGTIHQHGAASEQRMLVLGVWPLPYLCWPGWGQGRDMGLFRAEVGGWGWHLVMLCSQERGALEHFCPGGTRWLLGQCHSTVPVPSCSHHVCLYPFWDMSCLIWSQLHLGTSIPCPSN